MERRGAVAIASGGGLLRARHFYVYILGNRPGGVLYTGMTNDLKRRVSEHKSREGGGFTKRYNIDRLVSFEVTDDVADCDRKGEADQGRAASQEDRVDRRNQSELGRSVR